jgi:two-component system chemotaxis response regulator CheB
MGRKIRVLVVDDSAFVRQVLKRLLALDPAIEVVGVASDPIIAEGLIQKLEPDVLTLDVEMPRMDGLTFLETLMRERPMPVVMVSSRTQAGCGMTLRALELGAVDFVSKPKIDLTQQLPAQAQEIADKVKAAAVARVRPWTGAPTAARVAVRRPWPSRASPLRTTQQIVAVGASTGGTEALRVFLQALPADAPAVIIVQHMPEAFTRAFANRLDSMCTVKVKEAASGDHVLDGHALIAPGNHHLRLARAGSTYSVTISREAPVNRHRPSVDVLFESCAEIAGASAVGVLMTGMGDDGARGLLAMREAGARTLVQDEATCVVFGMPKAAIECGAAERVLPLDRLAEAALALARGNRVPG